MIESVSLCDWLRRIAVMRQTDGTLPLPDVDYATAMTAACFHGLEPQALRAWRSVCLAAEQPPPDGLNARLRELAIQSLAWVRQLKLILDVLQQANVTAVPLKGPILAQIAHGESALRECRDLDFLIHHSDIDRAREALLTAGFYDKDPIAHEYPALWRSVNYEWTLVNPQSWAQIELHWTLTPPYFVLPSDTPAILARATTMDFDGQTWPWLSAEDTVLFLCIHGAKHEWRELRLAAELHGLLAHGPRVDWHRLRELAAESHALRIVGLALGIVRALDPDLVALDIADTAIPGDRHTIRKCRDIVQEWPSLKPLSTGAQYYRFLLSLRPRLSDKISVCTRLLVCSTPADWQWLKLPAALQWAYPAVRVLRLIVRREAT